MLVYRTAKLTTRPGRLRVCCCCCRCIARVLCCTHTFPGGRAVVVTTSASGCRYIAVYSGLNKNTVQVRPCQKVPKQNRPRACWERRLRRCRWWWGSLLVRSQCWNRDSVLTSMCTTRVRPWAGPAVNHQHVGGGSRTTNVCFGAACSRLGASAVTTNRSRYASTGASCPFPFYFSSFCFGLFYCAQPSLFSWLCCFYIFSNFCAVLRFYL